MDTGDSGWNRLADRNLGVAFLDACLRGASQVLLQNNPITGLLILIGIAWAAIATGHPTVIIGVLIALIVGTATAILLRADATAVRTGLYGFNPLLTGAGVTVFMENRPLMWLFLVLGAAATTVVMFALTAVLNTWDIPALTFPFVLTTWFLLMGAYPFARLTLDIADRPVLPGSTPVEPASWNTDVVAAFPEGVSQVFLVESWVAGLIILVALAVNSWWSAGFAAVGAVLGTLLAIWFGAGASTVEAGLWGFNAVLTAVALGTVFYKPTVATAIYALFGVVFTVFVQAALSTVLAPLGIPTLTAPFVIATWLFVLPKRNFAPVAQHKRYTGGLLTALRPDAAKPE
jgi:urea transporter